MVLMGHLSYAGVVKQMTTSIERCVAKETCTMSLVTVITAIVTAGIAVPDYIPPDSYSRTRPRSACHARGYRR